MGQIQPAKGCEMACEDTETIDNFFLILVTFLKMSFPTYLFFFLFLMNYIFVAQQLFFLITLF